MTVFPQPSFVSCLSCIVWLFDSCRLNICIHIEYDEQHVLLLQTPFSNSENIFLLSQWWIPRHYSAAAESMRMQPFFLLGANLPPYKLVIVSAWSITVIWLCDTICRLIFLHIVPVGRVQQQEQSLFFRKKTSFSSICALVGFCMLPWHVEACPDGLTRHV